MIHTVGDPAALVPTAALVVTTFASMTSIGALSICLSRRLPKLRYWRSLALNQWLVLAIYFDSVAFVAATAVLGRAFGVNSAGSLQSPALLMRGLTMSFKVLIYTFLVEKAHIVGGAGRSRLNSKLYLFNCFGMLLPYMVIIILNFIWRIATLRGGVCIIGMRRKAMVPLVIFDVLVNIYMTALFIIPLRRLYAYQNNPNSGLRTITFRTFVGSLATLTSSVVNLSILMILRGEAAWICLLSCNLDVLFSTLVLHWVTNKDTIEKKDAKAAAGGGVIADDGTYTCKSCNPAQFSTFATTNFTGFSRNDPLDADLPIVTEISGKSSPNKSSASLNLWDRNVKVKRNSEKGVISDTPDAVMVQTEISWEESNV
ncbi:MAG: hypothetical protein M1818_003756 [Claussenomyces sp. TS43310]|nr:MAG: hypothetical protein M1818_003756 [Claussenomyces sp. TS43310]